MKKSSVNNLFENCVAITIGFAIAFVITYVFDSEYALKNLGFCAVLLAVAFIGAAIHNILSNQDEILKNQKEILETLSSNNKDEEDSDRE